MDTWSASSTPASNPEPIVHRVNLEYLGQSMDYERSPSSTSDYSIDARSFATFGSSSNNSSVGPVSPVGRSIEIRPHPLYQARDTPVDEATTIISPVSAFGFHVDRPSGHNEFQSHPQVFLGEQREISRTLENEDASGLPSGGQGAKRSQSRPDALLLGNIAGPKKPTNTSTQNPSLDDIIIPTDLSRLSSIDPLPSPRTLMRVPWNIAADGSYAETTYEPAAQALKKQLNSKLGLVKDTQRERDLYTLEAVDRDGQNKMFRIRSATPPPGQMPTSIFAFSSADPRSFFLDPVRALFAPDSPLISSRLPSDIPEPLSPPPIPHTMTSTVQHSRSRSESKPSDSQSSSTQANRMNQHTYLQKPKEKGSLKVRVSKSMQSMGAVFRGFDKDSKSYGDSNQNEPSRQVVGLMSAFQPTPSVRRRQSSSNLQSLKNQPVTSFFVNRPPTPVLSSSRPSSSRTPEQLYNTLHSSENRKQMQMTATHLRGMRSWESTQSDDTARPGSSRSALNEEEEDGGGKGVNLLRINTEGMTRLPMEMIKLVNSEGQKAERAISAPVSQINFHRDTNLVDHITRFQAADIYCRTQLFDYLAGDVRLTMSQKDHEEEGEDEDETESRRLESWNPLAEDDPRFALWDVCVPASEFSIPSSAAGVSTPSPSTDGAHETWLSDRSDSPFAISTSSLGVISLSLPTQFKQPSSPSRRLVGATLERWIHHLTLHFDREAIYAFLLTYRVFCSPLDLCRLLISRFEWTITPDLQRGIDEIERLKTMARVRTFHVWKIWLMYFFEVDWLGNPEMRVLTADWVNDMRKREDLDQVPSAMSLIKKLKELLKERRGTYNSPAGLTAYQSVLTTHSPAGSIAPSQTLSQHHFSRSETSLGRSAQPTYAPFNISTSTFLSPSVTAESSRLVGQSLNRKKSALRNLANGTTSGPPPLQAHSIAKLWGSLGRYARASFGTTFGDSNASSNSNYLSTTVIHKKSSTSSLPQKGDLLIVEGGLDALFKTYPNTETPPLTDRESLMSISSSSNRSKSSEDDHEERSFSPGSGPTGRPPIQSPMLDSVLEERFSHEYENELGQVVDLHPSCRPPSLSNASTEPATPIENPNLTPPQSPSSTGPASSRTTSATSIGMFVKVDRPASGSSDSMSSVDRPSASSSGPNSSTDVKQAGWTPMFVGATIVADDFDLSDSDDENYNPLGSSKGRETWGVNLERRSLESLEEVDQSPKPQGIESAFSSLHSSSRKVSSRPSTPKCGRNALGHSLFQYFNPSDVASEAEPVFVEQSAVSAALARLEGRYDEEAIDRVEARKRKVEERIEEAVRSAYLAWKNCLPPTVIASEEMVGDGRWGRMMGDRESLIEFSDKDEVPESSVAVVDSPAETSSPCVVSDHSRATSPQSPSINSGGHEITRTIPQTPSKRPSSDSDRQVLSPGGRNLLRSPHGSVQRLQSFNVNPIPPIKFTATTTKTNFVSPKKAKTTVSLGSRLKSPISQMEHRSFILDIKTSVLAEQFCLIDAGYLNAIGFQELTSQPLPWLAYSLPAKDDWSDLLKEKAMGKANRSRIFSDVDILMKRSEMVIRWVQSEIILTKPSDRPAIVGRFIKLAAQCYNRFNMQSTINILLGLQTSLIKSCTGKKVFSKIGAYERGLYRDLQELVTPENGWVGLRDLQEGMISRERNSLEKSLAIFSNLDIKLKTNSNLRDPATKNSMKLGSEEQPFFIPYLGIYIQDLEEIAKMPDHLFPYPEPDLTSLPPLPPWLHRTPILNLEKLRARASITKNICILKTLASSSNLTPEAGPFRLCFKLRALPDEFVKIIAREYKS
ncbi:Ras1 guanine nucleotide exchange factor [Phaffia rhodozyma]|uniref:Ras1 guanine nucleotide exchange factor n=1 Tax=Phaffia rhodozyma TaxID=264483 RepID=A0A0F7SUR9_PHARH|nr:Ras1 guanine nucleotide exchange factor [Phaffia rhodozyma]